MRAYNIVDKKNDIDIDIYEQRTRRSMLEQVQTNPLPVFEFTKYPPLNQINCAVSYGRICDAVF